VLENASFANAIQYIRSRVLVAGQAPQQTRVRPDPYKKSLGQSTSAVSVRGGAMAGRCATIQSRYIVLSTDLRPAPVVGLAPGTAGL
jgi:hypothetical protein